MQFNDTTGLNGIIQECEFLTGIGAARISGNTPNLKLFTRLCNIAYHEVITMILQSQDSWDYDDINQTDYPIITTSLVANQQDYTFPASLKMLKVKRVEVSYDNGNTWKRANPIDLNEIGKATDSSSITGNFTTAEPYYDIQYNALFLYPTPAASSTNGLKVWISREVDEFTTSDTTQEPGIDKPFHQMIPLGAALHYGLSKRLDNRKELAEAYATLESRLRQHYGSKQKDQDNFPIKSAFVDMT